MSESHDDSRILNKNTKAASMWSGGGRAYDQVSQGIGEGIRHCVVRLRPKPDERILDIATGTGLTAREISRSGAKVTGVDIAEGLLEAAKHLSEEKGLSIDWQIGDAEDLPFDDASFDAAASTFGIMFATNQDAAISELSRVVRPGGRIAIAAWLPDSTAVALRKVISPFAPPPPPSPPPPPFNWGKPEWLKENLGSNFTLGCETAELTHRFVDAGSAWRVYADGFGPIQATYQALDDEQKAAMKAEFLDWVNQFSTDLGIALTYQYLVTVGVRK